MEVWDHGGLLFEVLSGYSLPEDAWHYELTGLAAGPAVQLRVLIPDATPDGPFTPMSVDDVRVQFTAGELPWPIVARFLALVERSGDLRRGVDDVDRSAGRD